LSSDRPLSGGGFELIFNNLKSKIEIYQKLESDSTVIKVENLS